MAAERPAPAMPGPAERYDWQQAAKKEAFGGAAIQRLGDKKVLVAGPSFKQIFEPYIHAGQPLFITSDSLLAGFHVLFEESLLRLEVTNARRLGGVLKCIWANLPKAERTITGQPELVKAAGLRARVVIATALQLLGEKVELPAALAPLVRAEVLRVETAQERAKPRWLGPPDRGFHGLDYTRFKPRGFYAQRPSLQRYFRAVGWLQAIPFRLSSDEELAAILLLGRCASGGAFEKEADRGRELRDLFRGYDALLGSGDGWHLLAAADLVPFAGAENTPFDLASETKGLARVRARFIERAKRDGATSMINDQLAFIAEDPATPAEPSLRVIAARRTPDAVLFGRTTDPRRFQRDLPSGLELCAVLGSPFARARLAAQGQATLIEEIGRSTPLFCGRSLYYDYLRCLRVLVGKPEPGTPPLLSGEAWQIKSCQTVLGGWAQLRHTWALQSKENAHWLCASRLPPGVIEPVPEFFARMARLSERARPILREAGAFEIDPVGIAVDLRNGVVADKKLTHAAEEAGNSLRGVTIKELELADKVSRVRDYFPAGPSSREAEDYYAQEHQQMIALAQQLEQGRIPSDPSLLKALRAMSPDLDSRWQTLATLCHRLETLAHKQLRGTSFSKEDNQWITDYGATLAQVMFYDGNSYVSPNDDAPRVADVFSNPSTGQFMEVGIARPRALYVLYPIQGREILCRGAVFPYHEFACRARLTDAEWKSLLDSPERPETPEWCRPISVQETAAGSKKAAHN
jgi:hypothetical protein